MNIGISPACPACGSCDTKQAFEKDGYQYYSCKSCATLFVWPRPTATEIADFYRFGSQKFGSSLCWDEGLESHGHVLYIWKSLLMQAENLCGKGPLLDIGCGTGSFLKFAKSLGRNELTGIEIVPEAAEIALKNKEIRVYNDDFLSCELPLRHFAVIALFDIIEHVIDAKDILERAFNLLKPGGALIIGTVNRQGFSLRMLGKRALTVCPPEHLTIFSRGGLVQLLNRTGFNVKFQRSASIYLREWVRFVAMNKLSQSRDDGYGKFRSGLFNSKMFIAAVKTADVILNAFNIGDELYFLAQKGEGP